jgi:hypothetical protein
MQKALQIQIIFLGIFLTTCGTQKVVQSTNQGPPNLIIEDITSERLSSVSSDQYSRPQIANAKRFDFTITITNIGGEDFVGNLSTSNTRDDLNNYVHTERVSSESIRIGVNQSFTFNVSDFFPYDVK